MKIPNELPKFKDKTIVMVAGCQGIVIYEAQQSDIHRVDAFKVPGPHYSDRECEFRKRGKTAVIGSGAVREIRDQDIIKDFLHEFKRRTKCLNKFSRIYILAPAKIKNELKAVLPVDWQNKVKRVIEGNYFKMHPLYVIKKIAESSLALKTL